MRLLAPDIPPLQSDLDSYATSFIETFFEASDVLMVVGYVAADAIVELRSLIENNVELRNFNLVVGMAKFDGLFRSQFEALGALDRHLREMKLGQVHIAVAMPIHAKASVFSSINSLVGAIVGSSNLSGLVNSFRQYEVDVFIDEPGLAADLLSVLRNVKDNASRPFIDLSPELKILENPNLILDGLPNVERVSVADFEEKKTETTFELVVKSEAKSNLNTYFGKGRLQRGHIIPRPWYEVELIVGVETTRQEGYPRAGTPEADFEVITDDGWRFSCQVQGAGSKNFRSKDDLKTLGKWIKERLQNSGALTIGEPVTEITLASYGRNTITFTRLDEPNLWFLDFARPFG